MKPYIINLVNSVVLIVLGLWGYLGSDSPSFTALIPVITGAVLLILTPWFKKENKVVAHVAVLLTFLIIIGLLMPLRGAMARGDELGIFRVAVMLISSITAMIVFINSFVQARKNKD
jgi:lipid-A-disaccharide synthase-like uncharacterized protein